MRRLTNDRGGMAVAIGVIFAALLPLMVLAVDAGMVFEERRQLQNGADAAVLAYAYNCARTGDCSTGTGQTIAAEYVPANASDGFADVYEVTYDPSTRTASVTARSQDASGDLRLSLRVAQLVGFEAVTVAARAEARITGVGSALSIPLVACQSVWEHYTGGVDGLPTSELLLRYAPAESADQHLEDHEWCGDYPGGFGWLSAPNCEAETTEDSWAEGTPGNTPASGGCHSSALRALLIGAVDSGEEILVPIFDDHAGSGSSGQYHLIGYGAFVLTGFRLQTVGQYQMAGESDCTGNVSCLRGQFIEFVPLEAVPSDTSGQFGAWTVRLSA